MRIHSLDEIFLFVFFSKKFAKINLKLLILIYLKICQYFACIVVFQLFTNLVFLKLQSQWLHE